MMTHVESIKNYALDYGILHDQILSGFSLEGDHISFTFDIVWNPEHDGIEFCERYRDYTRCDVTFETIDISLHEVVTKSWTKGSLFLGHSMALTEFLALLRRYPHRAEFLSMAPAGPGFDMNLAVDFQKIGWKHRLFRCSTFTLSMASPTVEFRWY